MSNPIEEAIKTAIFYRVPGRDYLGTPYASSYSSDYNYFAAHPSNKPESPEEHWTSRNPVTGQLLKRSDHPTFALSVLGESDNKFYKDLQGNTYTFPKEQSVQWPYKQFEYKFVINENDIKNRQAWAESAGNNNAVSHRGAVGKFQIMPITLEGYQNATGDIGDLLDPVYNEKVRDWSFNKFNNSDLVNKGNPNDLIKMARKLAIYNWGFGNTRDAINTARKEGIDVDHGIEWMEILPKETRDYINFILFNQDTGSHRNNKAYNNRKTQP